MPTTTFAPVTIPVALYAIALGSNRRTRHGSPAATLQAAVATLGGVIACSPVLTTAPVGPSARRFANAVALIESAEAPPALLDRLKAIERAFGRRRGQRWSARPIDLDIVLWSGGMWSDSRLTVPHRLFRTRDFVLRPLAAVAPRWRDPLTGLSVMHLAHMVDRRRPHP
ncbi:hypothetical protein ASE75_03760 [Sphingomonas sp. Leaf17]|uniref:2-amino-4-hydroxy-6- hydroxymethyldihydropteridine diphosphokinase n=1 Tax=Sphingomonas sp. Leaf17 TaxID=1735683 RepID=UPI0006F97A50|nr:2-amino-4-hydroxy-6-hydroxymethyldihydropteridine diphosphokinase [Sphingomonas sp. Leaf17]KQM68187.1 hypothetical protein ASE75_03760 [Sphingomonas sp. Leaf17]